ncbi:predicted protein [Arabidopsis lyrata subsp. lyrata]|uniref:Predicted protein n=1 Tax=Arabidopsis lyrata subsp. lyrata TaxID=81972 RepID=D7LPQ1_ARALL|nr:predicted protein [Arabidopsis lyrata subsp. lyrata]
MEGDEVSGRESGVHAPMYGPQSTPITGMKVSVSLFISRPDSTVYTYRGDFTHIRSVEIAHEHDPIRFLYLSKRVTYKSFSFPKKRFNAIGTLKEEQLRLSVASFVVIICKIRIREAIVRRKQLGYASDKNSTFLSSNLLPKTSQQARYASINLGEVPNEITRRVTKLEDVGVEAITGDFGVLDQRRRYIEEAVREEDGTINHFRAFNFLMLSKPEPEVKPKLIELVPNKNRYSQNQTKV